MQVASNPSRNTVNTQPRKLRSACDQCHASKLKCPGGTSPCKRCENSGQACHYSLAARLGKPPGSKNRKTLERIRRANSNIDIDGPLNDTTVGNDAHSTIRRNSTVQMAQVDNTVARSRSHVNNDDSGIDTDCTDNQSEHHFDPFSYTMNAQSRPPPSQRSDSNVSSLVTNVDVDMHINAPGAFDNDCLLPPVDFSIPDELFDKPATTPFGSGWLDVQQGSSWNSKPFQSSLKSPAMSLGTSSSEPSSTTSAYSRGTPSSLDMVAAQLDTPDSSHGSYTDFLTGPKVSCRCLQKHTDALSQLRNIESRQNPVRVDTLLTCTNLVLSMAEEYFRCSSCVDDPHVLIQVIMMLKMIFGWTEAQCHASESPCPDLPMSLGRHELARDEVAFVQTALLNRSMERNRLVTKAISGRVDQMVLSRQGRKVWSHERDEIQILQQLTASLSQYCTVTSKRLAARLEQSKFW